MHILITGNNLTERENKINLLVKGLENWVIANGLSLNLKKTKYMIFSCGNNINLPFEPKIFKSVIEREKSARFIGVIIDKNLTWREHILAVKSKISRYVGILYKFKKILPLSVRKNIYYGLVHSHINYCSLVWGPGSKASIKLLSSEQKNQSVL